MNPSSSGLKKPQNQNKANQTSKKQKHAIVPRGKATACTVQQVDCVSPEDAFVPAKVLLSSTGCLDLNRKHAPSFSLITLAQNRMGKSRSICSTQLKITQNSCFLTWQLLCILRRLYRHIICYGNGDMNNSVDKCKLKNRNKYWLMEIWVFKNYGKKLLLAYLLYEWQVNYSSHLTDLFKKKNGPLFKWIPLYLQY